MSVISHKKILTALTIFAFSLFSFTVASCDNTTIEKQGSIHT